jgi:hypothetical protein
MDSPQPQQIKATPSLELTSEGVAVFAERYVPEWAGTGRMDGVVLWAVRPCVVVRAVAQDRC